MPVKVNNQYLVPAPLVDFNKTYFTAENGETIGAEYTINLAGTILPNKGNPIVDSGTFLSSFSTDSWTSTKSPDDDPNHNIDLDDSLLSLMGKQEQIRKLFAIGQAVEVEIIDLNTASSGIKFIGTVESVNFPSDGRWVNPCPYTVNLRTANFKESVGAGEFTNNYSEDEFKYFVKSATENWTIAEGDEKIYAGTNTQRTIKTYNLTHNISAVGQAVYSATGTYDAGGDRAQTNNGRYDAPYLNGLAPWQQASGYVYDVLQAGTGNFVNGIYYNGSSFAFGDSFFGNNGNDIYMMADRVLSEDIDVKGGAYSVNETFKLYPSGDFNNGVPVIHTTDASINRGENGISSISIQGNIVGLNTTAIEISGVRQANRHESNAFSNAVTYYNDYLSQNVTSGGSRIYHLARNLSELSWLHPEPLSNSIGKNPRNGTISYNFNYDNRPPNIIQNSISEDIQVQDTYPGQIFASIPVIGRNQPVLQYLNSRSEYKRSLSINIQMRPWWLNDSDNNWLEDSGTIISSGGYWSDAIGVDTTVGADGNDGITWWRYNAKPSVLYTADFQKIYDAVNPAEETAANGFANPVIPTRVFHGPPQESWNPKTGAYSYSIEWVFERTY